MCVFSGHDGSLGCVGLRQGTQRRSVRAAPRSILSLPGHRASRCDRDFLEEDDLCLPIRRLSLKKIIFSG